MFFHWSGSTNHFPQRVREARVARETVIERSMRRVGGPARARDHMVAANKYFGRGSTERILTGTAIDSAQFSKVEDIRFDFNKEFRRMGQRPWPVPASIHAFPASLGRPVRASQPGDADDPTHPE